MDREMYDDKNVRRYFERLSDFDKSFAKIR